MEYAKTNDVVASVVIARPGSEESARAMGKFTFECFDKDGNLKWSAEKKNLVVNVGLQYMAGTSLDGATSRITSWYVGLYGAGASNTPAASDTMSSHGDGRKTQHTVMQHALLQHLLRRQRLIHQWLQTRQAKQRLTLTVQQLLVVRFLQAIAPRAEPRAHCSRRLTLLAEIAQL